MNKIIICRNFKITKTVKKYIKYLTSTTGIESLKFTGMPEESIKNIDKSGKTFAQTFADHNLLPEMNSNGHFNKKYYFSP